MTYLRSISRFVVVLLTLAGIAAAATVPAGWVALRYEAPAGDDKKGHWIIVKAPADGLDAWWSDAELAKIAAKDPDYVKRLETDWTPVDHETADSAEAELLAAELAKYWGGDLPQTNFWAHGAMTRRGDTPRAFRWEQDGLTQRSKLESAGKRPRITAAAIDPDPVDQRYSNSTDLVTYGDRWGSHLRTGTIDHVYTAESNKAKRRHNPNSPPAGEVAQKTKETVEACRQESLDAELGVFTNYVRGWGGLGAKSVSFSLPVNCVTNPGPPAQTPPSNPTPVTPPSNPTPVTPPSNPTPVTPPSNSNPSTPPSNSNPSTPPSNSNPSTPPSNSNPGGCTPFQQLFGQCTPVSGGDDDDDDSDSGGGGGSDPITYTDCNGDEHDTQDAADAVDCSDPVETQYPDCKGDLHDTQDAADAVNCSPPVTSDPIDDPQYTACDGTLHHSQEDADAIDCYAEEPGDVLCSDDPFAAGCDQ